MKNIIVNIIILILMFNIIMIIFPEGKTQKFCRITIKIFIMIYIFDNIFLNGGLKLNLIKVLNFDDYSYVREVSIESIDQDFIDSINKSLFEGDDAVKNITLNFTEDMKYKAVITLNKMLSIDEVSSLKTKVAEIFQINLDDLSISIQ